MTPAFGELHEDRAAAQLSTYGWLPWPAAIALLGTAGAAGAAWLAPSGVLELSGGPWPGRIPLTTRIHAWEPASSRQSSSRQWRLVPCPAREIVLVTCLSPDHATLPEPHPACRSRDVIVHYEHDERWQRAWIHQSAAIMFLRPVSSRPED